MACPKTVTHPDIFKMSGLSGRTDGDGFLLTGQETRHKPGHSPPNPDILGVSQCPDTRTKNPLCKRDFVRVDGAACPEMFSYDSPPPFPAGMEWVFSGQRYRPLGVRDHVKFDGNAAKLIDWQTTCPGCGKIFTLSTGLSFNWPTRRCQDCKRPGVKVKPGVLA